MIEFCCGNGASSETRTECGLRGAGHYNRLEPSPPNLRFGTFPVRGRQPWDNPLQSLLPSRKGMA